MAPVTLSFLHPTSPYKTHSLVLLLLIALHTLIICMYYVVELTDVAIRRLLDKSFAAILSVIC